MQNLKILILISIFFMNFTLSSFSQSEKTKDAVIIPKGQSRSFMLMNTNATFFFSETGCANTSAFQGLNVQTYEFLEDYILEVNRKTLDRKNSEAYLYVDKLVRRYDDINLDEEITLLDSLPVLVIKITSSQKLPIALAPIISGAGRSNNFVTHWNEEDKVLYIAKRNHTIRNDNKNYPVWTGVCTFPHAEFLKSIPNDYKSYVGFEENKAFLPGKLTFFLDNTAYIFFIIGDSKNDVLQKRKHVLKKFNIFFENSVKKIEGVRKT